MDKKINVDGYGEVTVLEELSDSELEEVSGGSVPRAAYIHECKVCGRKFASKLKVIYCCNQKTKNGGKIPINFC